MSRGIFTIKEDESNSERSGRVSNLVEYNLSQKAFSMP